MSQRTPIDVEAYLAEHEKKELLRFVAVGSVDDGKSTLIGRLLHDTHGVYEDQLEDARQNAKSGHEIDFALITDGLAAEREQGITIDVAYRYFSTATRKFIIADTPGHVQYTRNMATGASTADVCVILIDARLGVLQQSRRHAYIASMLGIPHLFVCVNKMDLVGFDESKYDAIRDTFDAFSRDLAFRDITYLPISALDGDNVVTKSERSPWYTGRSLLEELESVSIAEDRNLEVFRLPVQTVIRPHQNYRGFAGQIASGCIQPGDPITVLPSGKQSRVTSVEVGGEEVPDAYTPLSVTLRLEDEIDVSRGDLILGPGPEPLSGRQVEAMVVWLGEHASRSGAQYLIKHTTRYVRATLTTVQWRLDVDTLEQSGASRLELNDIGRVHLDCNQPLCFDPYSENRSLGAFVIVDALSNNTVGAGMLLGLVRDHQVDERATGIQASERAARLGYEPCVVLLEGLEVDLRRVERMLFGHISTIIALSAPNVDTLKACCRAGAVVISAGDAEDAERLGRLLPAEIPVHHMSTEGAEEDLVARVLARVLMEARQTD